MELSEINTLIIDDNEIDQYLLQRSLVSIGHSEKKIRIVDDIPNESDSSYDLVLCDLTLLSTSGFGTIEKVTAVYPESAIVMLTGMDDLQIASEAIQKGVQDYLIKGELGREKLKKAIHFAIERKSLQRAQKQMKGQYELFFENSPTPLIVCNQDTGKIENANLAAESLYGYSIDLFKGLCFDDLNMSGSKGDFERLEKTRKGTFTHCNSAGKPLIAEVGASKLPNLQEQQLLLSVHDITDKVKTEKELSLSNERYEYASKAASDIIYDWDISSNDVFWGNSLNQLLGYETASQFNVSQWISSIHPEDRSIFLDSVNEIISGSDYAAEWEREYRIRKHKNGYIYVLDKAVIIRDENNKPSRIIGALEDISERKAAEEILRTSEEKYSLLYNKSPFIKFIIREEDGMLLDANDAALVKTGSTREHLREYKFSHFLTTGSKRRFRQILNHDVNTLRKEFGVCNFKTRKGHQLKLEITGVNIVLEGEDCLFLNCMDVTDKVQAERALNASNERYMNVIKATNDAVWEWDLETNDHYFADNYERIFGYKPGKLSENYLHWKENIHITDRDRVIETLGWAIHSSTTKWEETYRYKKADGTYAFVEDVAEILRRDTGTAYKMVGAMKDITRKKEKEHELKLIESVVTEANDAVLITNAELVDYAGPRIIFANEAFYQMSGYSADEIIGSSPSILHGPKTEGENSEKLMNAMISHEPCMVELINYKKSGEEYWVELSISPVSDEQGNITHWISIQRDITEKKAKDFEKEFFKELNMEMLESIDFNTKLKVAIQKMCEVMSFSCAEMWLTNLDSTKLNRVAVHVNDDKCADFIHKSDFIEADLSDEDSGRLWNIKKPIIWDDLPANVDFVRHSHAGKNKINSALAIPIFYEERLVALILFFSKEKLSHRTSDFTFLERLSERLGPEIQRMKSEEETRTFFDLSPEALCIAGFDGYFKKVNTGFCQILGYTEKEILSMTVRNLLHPDDEKYLLGNRSPLLSGNSQTISFVSRFRTKEGKFVWLDWSANMSMEQGYIYGAGKDITRQKELETFLDRANDLARLGNWEINLDSGIGFWSNTTREIHGFHEDYNPSLEEVLACYKEGDSLREIKHVFQEAMAGKLKNWDIEVQLVRNENEDVWVRSMGEVELVDGKPVRLFGNFQDINERKLIEEELTEINLRYKLATMNTIFGVWDYKLANDQLDWDEGMYRLYGLQSRNTSNSARDWERTLHPEDLQHARDHLERSIQNKTNYDTRFRIIQPNGIVKHIRAFAQTICDSDGEVVRMVGVNYDITEEIAQQYALERALSEKVNILESINDGFLTVDLEWNVTYWNKAAEEMLQVAKGDILGHNLWEIYKDEVPVRIYKEYHKVLKSQQPVSFEQFYPRLKVWVYCSVYPNDSGLSVFFKDITAQKLHQEEVLEKSIRSMEKERNRIAQELHDGVLQEMVGSMMIAEKISRVLDANKQNKSLAEDLVHFLKKATMDTRKISHDLRSPEIENATLFTLLEKLIDQLNLLYDIEFKLDMSEEARCEELSEFVKTNLYRVIQELLTNAIKHAECSEVKIKAESKNSEFSISVSDNGIGFVGDKSASMHKGIGMRNIEDRLKAMGADLNINSKLNKGSHFKIKIKEKSYEENTISR